MLGSWGAGAALSCGGGVGTIGICDNDTVSLSNLQRQVVHTTAAVGIKNKSAKATLRGSIHPKIIEHRLRLDASNALDIIRQRHRCRWRDNFPTRFLVSDACYFARKPLVSAAVGQFDGQISTFKPYEKAPSGEPWPTYRCFIGELPERGLFPACEEVGILGALPGIVGSMQAMEVIKEILGIGDSRRAAW